MHQHKTLAIKGGKPLSGEVALSGAKNEATKMMVASLLTDEPCVLENCPDLGDTRLTAEIIEAVGGSAEFADGTATLHTPKAINHVVPELSQRNRIPILAIAPLLHRLGKAEVPLVAGDKIGPRPVNFHIEALKKMGAKVRQKEASFYAEAENGLKGTVITLPYPSVGATETVIFAGVLAKGITILRNSAIEPEIMNLILLLKKMGADISNDGRNIIITGVSRLKGANCKIKPDRNEAVSFACLAYASRGDITIKEAQSAEIKKFLEILDAMGAKYEKNDDSIRFYSDGKIKPVAMETDVHPGFMTDWQSPLTVVLSQASGQSTIHETVYEERLGYTEILNSMGGLITVSTSCLGSTPCRFAFRGQPHSAIIEGPSELRAKDFAISDIRAGVATIIASLSASGISKIKGIHHIERGYENFFDKIRSLGAEFKISS